MNDQILGTGVVQHSTQYDVVTASKTLMSALSSKVLHLCSPVNGDRFQSAQSRHIRSVHLQNLIRRTQLLGFVKAVSRDGRLVLFLVMTALPVDCSEHWCSATLQSL